MSDLRRQLRTYGQGFETQMTPVTLDQVRLPEVLLPPKRRGPDRKLIAVLAAIVLVVLANVLVFLTRGDSTPVATTLPQSAATNGWVAYQAGSGEFPSKGEALSPGGADIFLVMEGEAAHRVFGSDEDHLDQSCPAFSPDGRSLAYLEDGWIVLNSVDAAGHATETARFRVETTAEICPRWSPDGSSMAYTAGPSTAGPATVEVLAVKPGTDVSQAVEVYGDDASILDLEWAPDGSAVAVVTTTEIWLAPIADANVVKVAGSTLPSGAGKYDEYSSLAWSPDSSHVAVDGWVVTIAADGSGGASADNAFLRVIDIDDGQVSELDAVPTLGAWYDISWSPDGRWIAYVDLEGALNLIAPDQGERITGFQESALSGAIWSPDGSRVVHRGGDGERWLLYSVSTDPSEDPAMLVEDPGLSFNQPSRISWQASIP